MREGKRSGAVHYPKNFNLQGPVREKNKAHRDVEYILCSLLGLTYPDASPEYAIKPAVNQHAVISFNTLDQVLVSCPNGVTYNLTCALRNANLNAFSLKADRHQAVLGALESFFSIKGDGVGLLSAEKLTGGAAVFRVEEDAVRRYANDDYININKLLRGDKFAGFWQLDLGDRRQNIARYFYSALLSISAVNKYTFAYFSHDVSVESILQNWERINRKDITTDPLLSSAGSDDEIELHRVVEYLPPGMTSSILKAGSALTMAGLSSYSEEGGKFSGKSEIYLRMKTAKTQSIEAVKDQYHHEKEHLRPPEKYWFPKTVSGELSDRGHLVIDVLPLHGLAAEELDYYLSEWALSVAYDEYLKIPYKDMGGGSRLNHGLSHHARAMSYVEAVVEYFARYADNLALREYCALMTHDEIEMIKVLMAFSKTGRESEVGFTDNPELFLSYQSASAENTANFLRQYLQLSEGEIEFYKEIQYYAGDPDYQTKATGSDEEKQRKIFLHHIATLSHKLDLSRCFEPQRCVHAVASYRFKEDGAQTAFAKLEELAAKSIYESYEDSLCDKDVFHVLDKLLYVKNMMISPDEASAGFLKKTRLFHKCIQKLGESVQSIVDLENLAEKFKNQRIHFLVGDYLSLFDPRSRVRLNSNFVYLHDVIFTKDYSSQYSGEIIPVIKCLYVHSSGEKQEFDVLINDRFVKVAGLLPYNEDGELLDSYPGVSLSQDDLSRKFKSTILSFIQNPTSEILQFIEADKKYNLCEMALAFLKSDFSTWVTSFDEFYLLFSNNIFDSSDRKMIIEKNQEHLSKLITSACELREILFFFRPVYEEKIDDKTVTLVLTTLAESGQLKKILLEDSNCEIIDDGTGKALISFNADQLRIILENLDVNQMTESQKNRNLELFLIRISNRSLFSALISCEEKINLLFDLYKYLDNSVPEFVRNRLDAFKFNLGEILCFANPGQISKESLDCASGFFLKASGQRFFASPEIQSNLDKHVQYWEQIKLSQQDSSQQAGK